MILTEDLTHFQLVDKVLEKNKKHDLEIEILMDRMEQKNLPLGTIQLYWLYFMRK